jgi:hypothetical protein
MIVVCSILPPINLAATGQFDLLYHSSSLSVFEFIR